MSDFARIAVTNVTGTFGEMFDTVTAAGKALLYVGGNVQNWGQQVLLLLLVTAALGVVAFVAYVIYLMINVAQPRILSPAYYVKTTNVVHHWIEQVNNCFTSIQKVTDNAAASDITQWWLSETNAMKLVDDFNALIIENNVEQLQRDIGAYVRLTDNLTRLKELAAGQGRDVRYCEDECLSNIIDNILEINGYTRRTQSGTPKTCADASSVCYLENFINRFDEYRTTCQDICNKSFVLGADIFNMWKGKKNNDTHSFPDEAQAYADGQDAAVAHLTDLQDALVAVQTLGALMGPYVTEMREFFSKRRRLTQESVDKTDLLRLLKLAPLSVWLENFGYACKKYWWQGTVDVWNSDKTCSRKAFYDTFTIDFADKLWLSIVRAPLAKYSNTLKKRALVESFSDPFSEAAKGFRKFERFVSNLFWMIGFFLTHFELTFSLLLSFVLATILWIFLALLSAPGLRFLVWMVYWYVPAAFRILYNNSMLLLYIALSCVLCVWEYVVRFVSGGDWSMEFLTSGGDCSPQMFTWHARRPDNAFIAPPLGCILPCNTGFRAKNKYDWICRSDEKWRPGLCPQQQIYRQYAKLGGTGRHAKLDVGTERLTVRESSDETGYDLLAKELDAYARRIRDMDACSKDPALAPYANYVQSICSNDKAISDPQTLQLCKDYFCRCDGNTTLNTTYEAWLCEKLNAFAPTDDTSDDNGSRDFVVFVTLCIAISFASLGVFTLYHLRST